MTPSSLHEDYRASLKSLIHTIGIPIWRESFRTVLGFWPCESSSSPEGVDRYIAWTTTSASSFWMSGQVIQEMSRQYNDTSAKMVVMMNRNGIKFENISESVRISVRNKAVKDLVATLYALMKEEAQNFSDQALSDNDIRAALLACHETMRGVEIWSSDPTV